jgi:hypothetical protein
LNDFTLLLLVLCVAVLVTIYEQDRRWFLIASLALSMGAIAAAFLARSGGRLPSAKVFLIAGATFLIALMSYGLVAFVARFLN